MPEPWAEIGLHVVKELKRLDNNQKTFDEAIRDLDRKVVRLIVIAGIGTFFLGIVASVLVKNALVIRS
jgi:hypothetical protein